MSEDHSRPIAFWSFKLATPFFFIFSNLGLVRFLRYQSFFLISLGAATHSHLYPLVWHIPHSCKPNNYRILSRHQILLPQGPGSKIQNSNILECLPNNFFPKGQKFEPPSYQSYQKKITKKNWVVCPIFFRVIKAAVVYMESWFMTRLPQELGQYFFLANSSAQWAKWQTENHQKIVQSSAHKRFFPKNLEHSKNALGKISREFCLRV